MPPCGSRNWGSRWFARALRSSGSLRQACL
jgi:hypothetical protein